MFIFGRKRVKTEPRKTNVSLLDGKKEKKGLVFFFYRLYFCPLKNYFCVRADLMEK